MCFYTICQIFLYGSGTHVSLYIGSGYLPKMIEFILDQALSIRMHLGLVNYNHIIV